MRSGAGAAAESERPSFEPGGGDDELKRAAADEGHDPSEPAHAGRPGLISAQSFLTLDTDDLQHDPSSPQSSNGSVRRSTSRTPPQRPVRSPRRSNVVHNGHKPIHSLAFRTATSDPFFPSSPKRSPASPGKRDRPLDGAQDPAAVWQDAIKTSLSAGGSESALARRASLRRNSGELFAVSPPPEKSPGLSEGSSAAEGGVLSDGEGFVTADEDDGVSPPASKGRSSRRVSREGHAQTLPTILDASPVMSRTLQSLRLTGPDEIPVSFRNGDDEEMLAADDTDEEAPRSIRQLVRSQRNLSRSSSREFTLRDEERLSTRDAERQNDGLGLNLELFEGPLSKYTPPVQPLLSRRSSSLDAVSGLSTPMDTPIGNPGSYPFPSTASNPTCPRRERTSFIDKPFPSPPLASPFIPIFDRAASPLALGQIDTAPTRPRANSSARQSPATPPWTSTPTSSSPISREASPALSVSHRASDEGFARPRPRTAGASLSSSKSFRRISSVFTIGRSRSTSGQSLQEMAEAEERKERMSHSTSNRPTAQRVHSDNSFFRTAPELSSPPSRASSGSNSPFFPSTSPRKSPLPPPAPLPSPRLASQASSASLQSNQPSPNGLFSSSYAPSPASTFVSPAPPAASTWRSTMSQEEYDALLAEHGQMEMRRQEVVWELAETERLFVEGLRSVMELFVLPLKRTEGGWIKGMPTAVARLMDWASDIVYLHSQISSALQGARLISPSPVVTRVAGVFGSFVSRLEIHQPYLVRFDAVNRIIEDMTADPTSDFGEFVRMQSALPECRGMSLGSYLLKPVQRLMKYPLFFRQLAELTPPSHPDHFDTLDLLDSTDTVIRVMQEVKTREDEYDQVKAIASRLRGLPIGFQLARRDRRLLYQGQLRRIHINERDRFLLETDGQRRAAARLGSAAGSHGLDPPPVLRFSPENSRPQSSVSEDDSGSSSAGAYDAGDLAAWPSPFTTPDSRHSNFSVAPASLSDTNAVEVLRPQSVNSQASSTSTTEDMPPPPLPSHNGAAAGPPPALAPPSSAFSNSMPVRRSSKRVVKTKAKESMVQVFVFSDLIVLSTSKGGDMGRWTSKVGSTRRKSVGGEDGVFKALETFGVTRVLGVSDLSGKTEHDHLIKLDLLPLSASSERLTPLSVGPVTSNTTALYFSLPTTSSSANSSPASPALSSYTARPTPTLDLSFQLRVQWLQAFERCYHFSYRSLTQRSLLNSTIAPITQTEHLTAIDTTFVDRNRQESLNSAMLSKSPGELYIMRFGEEQRKVAQEPEEDVEIKEEQVAEREERVFWAGRLQKVRRESDAQKDALNVKSEELLSSRRASR